MVTTTSTANNTRVRLKTIAIPPEHGGWGFLFEPIILGLAVVPSLAGLCLAVGISGAFLARHPLKLALGDWQRGKRYARTPVAERVSLIYGVIALTGLALAVLLAGFESVLPLVLVTPLVALSFISYAQHSGRDLLPELAGAAALAGTAPGIALAEGEDAALAFTLWVLLNARNLPSILYVRARLRLEKAKPYSLSLVFGAHVIAVLGILGLVLAGLAPVLALLAVMVLLVRASYGLSAYRQVVRTQTIGFLEIGYGLLAVVLAAVGYAFNL